MMLRVGDDGDAAQVPDTMSRRISSRLLFSSAAISVTPVMLPRGRDRLSAKPADTGSPLKM